MRLWVVAILAALVALAVYVFRSPGFLLKQFETTVDHSQAQQKDGMLRLQSRAANKTGASAPPAAIELVPSQSTGATNTHQEQISDAVQPLSVAVSDFKSKHSTAHCHHAAFASRSNSGGDWCSCPPRLEVECPEDCDIKYECETMFPDASWKPRCVRGYPSTCDACKCKATRDTPKLALDAEARAAQLVEGAGQRNNEPDMGRLIDFRRLPLCKSEIPPPPMPVLPDPPPPDGFETMTPRQKRKVYVPVPVANYTFVFVVSNGHTGTTFLGRMSDWRQHLGPGKKLQPGFSVQHETDPDKGALVQIPWTPNYCNDGMKYVAERKVPKIVHVLRARKQHTWIESGHQNMLGELSGLAQMLGKQVRFVRMRRNRLDVAYSYSQKGEGPCSPACIYCLCPLDPIARCPVDGETWGMLTLFQQYLWFVDELECQWQALVYNEPGITRVDLNWDKSISGEQLLMVAKFSGMDKAVLRNETKKETERDNDHVKSSKRSTKNYAAMEAEALQYQELLRLKHCDTYSCIPPLT